MGCRDKLDGSIQNAAICGGLKEEGKRKGQEVSRIVRRLAIIEYYRTNSLVAQKWIASMASFG